jgi:hypothetical protein
MITRQFTYRFEELPILRMPGGAYAGMISGDATIRFDENTRGWRIDGIWLDNESIGSTIMIQLEPDLGEDACGPYELVHDAILVDRDEAIGHLVDKAIDGDGDAA